MPWALSFLFLSLIHNDVSYILIDQHLLYFEDTTQRLRTLPDRHQTSVGIMDTNGTLRPALGSGCSLPTKNLSRRHRSPVSHIAGGLLAHHRNPQMVQRTIQR